MRIAELLELPALQKSCRGRLSLAVIGSGGKTTLLWALAKSLCHARVLVSTTVKMWMPKAREHDHFLDERAFAALCEADCGVSFAGTRYGEYSPAGPEKIGAPDPKLLAERRALFDYTLLEADGSRMLPFKGWATHEPVVPDYVDMTIAVIPLIPPGFRVLENTVHRMPLFCAISGACAGDTLLPEHLAAAIAHPQGLLAKAKGRIVLLFNQAESDACLEQAKTIVRLLPGACKKRIGTFVAASARQDTGLAIYE